MKEALWNKLTVEYKSYQVQVLSLSPSEIYGKCYEIDIIINFYEILTEKIGSMSDEMCRVLLSQDNILMDLYDCWLAKDDSNYSEMEKHISDELEVIINRAEKSAA